MYIIGTARYLGIHISNQFSASNGTFFFKTKNEKIANNKFIYFILKGNFEILLKQRKESMYPTTRIENIQSIKIPLPPLEEQKAITDQLEKKV